MRILCVHPGADYSVSDVYTGLTEALVRRGHEVGTYALNGHLEVASRYLMYQLSRLRRTDPSLPRRASLEEATVKASEGALLLALRGRADAVLIISALYFHPSVLYLLRAARVPVGIVFTESPYQDDQQVEFARLASVCWTNDRGSVPVLRQSNSRSYYLPAAYRADIHRPGPVEAATARHDVVFVGTMFQERLDLLAAVDWSGIDLGLYGAWDAIDRRSAAYRRLRPYVRGGTMHNDQAVSLYRNARISLNPYRTCNYVGSDEQTEGESVSPRGYELAAIGAFQLSSYRPEVPDLFGQSVPTFDGPADLERLIRHYLVRPMERALLADEARRRIVDHTFDTRARQLEEQLTGALLHNPFAVPSPISLHGKAEAAD